MKRERTSFLTDWLHSVSRKPLVVRGARQVGKTWLIRDFAQSQGLRLLELNFEKRPDWASLFSSNETQDILLNLRASIGGEIEPSRTLLFLDEIQAAPKILEKLRWFAEDMPELPVVAAGSLLDFALAKHEFSMPVGRINYMYLEPLSFEEFVDAISQHDLKKYIESYDWHIEIPKAIHSQLMKAVKEYLIVGGMPAAVAMWITNRSPESVSQVHFDLLSTYREDFAKYSGRLSTDRLEEIMSAIPRQLGRKFVYSQVNSDVPAIPLKQALEMLSKARICHRICATSANGLPLGAEVNEKYSKVIMLDCGLCGASLGLSLQQLGTVSEITTINSSGMAEQLVGQLLRTIEPPFISPSLYYWQRMDKGGNAEIDYIIQHESEVIPIEVKAGSSGALKSLHQFMKAKARTIAVRINSGLPTRGPVRVKDSLGSPVEYTLLSLPFYLLGQLHRLLNSTPQ